jgi:hypothetical protein
MDSVASGGSMTGITKLAALNIAIAACVLLSAHAHGAPLRLASISGEVTETHVAAGPNDTVYVLWFDRNQDSDDETAAIDIYFKRSLDGGASFEETVVIENGGTPDMLPQLAVGEDGTIYIVYCQYDYQDDYQGGQFSIFVNKSEDAGASFERETVYTEQIGDLVTCENFLFRGADIRIANNRIYYTWSGYREIFLARSDGENKFEVLDIEHEGNQDEYNSLKVNPSLAVDSYDNVYVAWVEEDHDTEGSANSDYNLCLSKLVNDQRQFSGIKVLTELGPGGGLTGWSFIVTHSADSVFIAYTTPAGCMTLSSDNGGESFSDPLNTTLGISSKVINYKTIMDSSDVMHFLYTSFDASSTLYYSKSLDYGESLGDTVRISHEETDTADMDWSQDKELAYIVWFNPQDNSIYFSNSLEAAGVEPQPAPDPNQPTTDGGGGGGGGGCFIKTCLES